MNSDIALMDRDRLQEEVERLRAAIRSFCDSNEAKRLPQTRRLTSLLPEGPATAPKLPSWDQLLSAPQNEAR